MSKIGRVFESSGALKHQIDRLVYKLYGLTLEEIRLVEETGEQNDKKT